MATYMPTKSVPPVGGDGEHGYRQNSSLQRFGVENIKALLDQAIAEKLDLEQLVSYSKAMNTFCIADLGCSVGPNTLIAVQNIIDAVKLKLNSSNLGLSSESIQFQVFFNDLVSNDFNVLFQSLPAERQYFAAGVPGGFHGRLFPDSSIHFVHSSYALHWLPEVPNEVVDKNSKAWNKGKIDYAFAPKEVHDAFSARFRDDMERFLSAREKEIVPGGLLAFIFPCLPDGTLFSECIISGICDTLGSCLMDLVHKGVTSEEKLDSFNLPRFYSTPGEITNMIDKNGKFSIEMMELLDRVLIPMTIDNPAASRIMASHMRATLGGLIKRHFGDEVANEVFDRLAEKLADSVSLAGSNFTEIFVILKRKV